MSSVRRNSRSSDSDDSCIIVDSDEDNMDEDIIEYENEMSEIICVSDEEDMASDNRNPERPHTLDEDGIVSENENLERPRILDEHNMAIENEVPKHSEQEITSTEICVICTDSVRNECHINSCAHIFCYECLKKWSMINSTCPLCIKRFDNISYTSDDGSRNLYTIPTRETTTLRHDGQQSESIMRPFLRNDHASTSSDQYIQMYRPRNIDGLSPGIMLRYQVYSQNLWSTPRHEEYGQFSRRSSEDYWNHRLNIRNRERLREFIYRDCEAIFLHLVGNVDLRYGQTHINALSREVNLVVEHAFEMNENSPYDRIEDYDRNAQFIRQSRSLIVQHREVPTYYYHTPTPIQRVIHFCCSHNETRRNYNPNDPIDNIVISSDEEN